MSEKWTPTGGKCFFCPKPDSGYALKDNNGNWQPACWDCVKTQTNWKPQKDEKKPLNKKENNGTEQL